LSCPSVHNNFKSAAGWQQRQRCLQKTAGTLHTCPNSTPTRGGGKTNRHAHAQGCQPLGAAVTPAIAKAIHREGPQASEAAIHTLQRLRPTATLPKRDERKKTNMHRWANLVGGGAQGGDGPQGHAWADRIAHPRRGGGWWHFAQAPFPAPPHALSLTNPALGANSYLKVMVPKSTNITFRNNKKWALLWSLNFSFKISYTFGLSIKVFLQTLTLVVPLWHCDRAGTPSEYTSLTFQAPLQVMHPFVKEVAFVKEAAAFG
jgi:hypothetical protein